MLYYVVYTPGGKGLVGKLFTTVLDAESDDEARWEMKRRLKSYGWKAYRLFYEDGSDHAPRLVASLGKLR